MKKSSFIILGLLLAGFIFPGKATIFPNLTNPFFLEVDANQLYISEGPTVYIYSLKDFKLMKKFGKAGEGPEEFKVSPVSNGGSVIIFAQTRHIVVNSIGRISYFTKNGNFIKQIQTASPMGMYKPMQDKFIGLGMAQTDKKIFFTFNIYDETFKKGKELYREEAFFQQTGDINPFDYRTPFYCFYDNKIFIDGKKETIHVYNPQGEKLYVINQDYGERKVTKDDENKVLHWYKTNPMSKPFFPMLKERLRFPDYFPKIRFFNVSDNKIYVLTYHQKNGKSQFFILDIKGKLLEKKFMPFFEKDEIQFSPYAIQNKKLYQLSENEKEEWELHITEI